MAKYHSHGNSAEKGESLVDRADRVLINLANLWKPVSVLAGVAIVASVAYLSWQSYQDTRANEASDRYFIATQGETPDAILLRELVNQYPDSVHGARAAFTVAEQAFAEKQWAEARVALQGFANEDGVPTLVRSRVANLVAYAFEQEAGWKDAGEWYARAFTLAATDSTNLINAVRCYEQAGDEAAIDALLAANNEDSEAVAQFKRDERLWRALEQS